jgi:hypothetical protein
MHDGSLSKDTKRKFRSSSETCCIVRIDATNADDKIARHNVSINNYRSPVGRFAYSHEIAGAVMQENSTRRGRLNANLLGHGISHGRSMRPRSHQDSYVPRWNASIMKMLQQVWYYMHRRGWPI